MFSDVSLEFSVHTGSFLVISINGLFDTVRFTHMKPSNAKYF